VQNRAKFGVGIGVIVVALSFLAWLGYGESKTYYHTIAEYQSLNASDRAHRMRLAGIVVEGSIKPGSGRVDFTLEEQGKNPSHHLCRQRSVARHVQRQVAGSCRGTSGF